MPSPMYKRLPGTYDQPSLAKTMRTGSGKYHDIQNMQNTAYRVPAAIRAARRLS